MTDLDKYQVVTEADRNHIMVDILIELERLTVLELVGVLTQLKVSKVMGDD